MVIKVEKTFEQLFDTVPTYDFENPLNNNQTQTSKKLVFSYGEHKSLNQFLLSRKVSDSYPLLWYIMPNKVTTNRNYATGDFEFVLATNTQQDLYNDQRMKLNFDLILYPNLDLVIQALQGANNVQILDLGKNNLYESTNYPHYGNAIETGNKTVHFWDAIKFKVRLTVKNICTLPISYNTNNLI